MRQSILAVTVLLVLSACNSPTPPGPGGEGPVTQDPDPQTKPPFDVTFNPAHLTLSNLEQGKIGFNLVRNTYRGSLWYNLDFNETSSLLKAKLQKDGTSNWISIDATTVPPGEYALGLVVQDEGKTRSVTRTVRITVTQDASLPAIAPLSRVRLRPGQTVRVPLQITPPADGTPPGPAVISSPAPDLLSATLIGNDVILQASPGALPQGLIPVTVQVTAGARSAAVRLPVEIGTLIEREYDRFNALRSQANLPAVAFDVDASMNCWMNGRYMLVNKRIEHNQNPALPFASPEGQACATNSNLAVSYSPVAALGSISPSTTILFTAPFHALGMLQPGQTRVGIGTFTAPGPTPDSASMGSGITSARGSVTGKRAPMTFPGNGATTDLASYNGGEWPDPLTACPGFDARQAGLPLIAATFESGETTATEASLTVAGQGVKVCAYGSAQYVNTKDQPGNYVGGPVTAQDLGRSLMRSSGAVFLIPAQPLKPGQTYQASVKINGKVTQWSFKTAGKFMPQSLDGPAQQQMH